MLKICDIGGHCDYSPQATKKLRNATVWARKGMENIYVNEFLLVFCYLISRLASAKDGVQGGTSMTGTICV
jgi:hypothetical protein